MKILIKQSILLPLYFFIPVILAGLMVPDYSIIKQHGSEITLTNFEQAKLILNSGAIVTGLSCLVLAFGIVIIFKKYFISVVLLIIFGVSMVTNGLYPMGNAMHGFYGIGLSYMLLPFAACYELKNDITHSIFFKISIITGFIVFAHFWSMLVGLDPENYRGLTQRLASIFIFGWIGYLAWHLSRLRNT